MKAICDKPTANINSMVKKMKAFPLRSGTRQGAHSYHFYSTQYWKLIKDIQIKKEDVKLMI